MAKTEYVGFRVPKNFVVELDELGKLERKGKSMIIREIFEMGIEEKRKELALELYKKGDVSIQKAAELAKLPLLDFIDFLESKEVSRKIDVGNIKKLLLEEFDVEV
ncbi:MAG: UPF0175 family protein [Methanocellales archaeon]|nr:UPF0175 family protein [Methanocellales archaeon]